MPKPQNTTTDLQIIGSTETIRIGRYEIPAKIDTGADSSAIWASQIEVDQNGILKFVLFDKKSPLYTGKVFKRTDFSIVQVRSTTGHQQIRYRTHFVVYIAGRKIKILMSLSDRSKNHFPALIGRRSISKKFLVDVSQNPPLKYKHKSTSLNQKLQKDKYQFHKQYFEKGDNL